MVIGFQTRIAETVTTDFHNFKLATAIDFVDTDGTRYQMPVGAPSDLASVPPEFWCILPPFGEYALEAYLHDCAYQNTLLVFRCEKWVKAALPKADCDNLFNRAMLLNSRIAFTQRETLFRAVVTCGGHAFSEDRA